MARGGNSRGDRDAQRKRAPQRGEVSNHHVGHGKRRRHGSERAVAPTPTGGGASAAFLAALEAQRAKQAAEEAPAQQPAAVPAVSSGGRSCSNGGQARVALPGFYYDETKGRYFKLTKQHQKLQTQEQQRRAAAREEAIGREQRSVFESGRAVRRRGWMAFLAERQLLEGRAVDHRDRRELMPRFVASRLKRQALSRVDVEIHPAQDRFSAMDISPDSSCVLLGYATGYVRAFATQADPSDGNASLVERGIVDTAGVTVSCIRHHRRERGILIAAVGERVSETLAPLSVRGAPETTGRVGLFGDSTFRQQPYVWNLNDPWVVEWCPEQANLFSVGLGGHQGAALVDCSAFCDGHVAMAAPTGRIKSDTLSQTFSQHTPVVIVNATRNGSWWIWDTRAPRRATEVLSSKGKQPGSIQCLRLLRDDRRLLTQRSDGELAVLDLRSPRHSPVTLFCCGEQGAYRSMLSFDVDENETVVASATATSLAMFDLSRGIELLNIRVPEHISHSQPQVPHQVERIIFRENERDLTLWGLSRSALYQSSNRAMR